MHTLGSHRANTMRSQSVQTERCSSLVDVASGAATFTLLLRRRVAFLYRTATCQPLFKPSVSLLSTGRQSSCGSNFYRTFKILLWLSLVYIYIYRERERGRERKPLTIFPAPLRGVIGKCIPSHFTSCSYRGYLYSLYGMKINYKCHFFTD